MKASIICWGIVLEEKPFSSLQNSFVLKEVTSVEEAMRDDLLVGAGVFLLGPSIKNQVREIQKIVSADKHLSVLLTSTPENIKQLKQAIQFAPFVGKNSLVIALTPEVNLNSICDAAMQRTKQKRSFFKFNLNPSALSSKPSEKIKVEQLGTFLEHAPIGGILIDETDHIINYNQQAKKIFPSIHFLEVEIYHLFTKEEASVIREFIHDGHQPDARKELSFGSKIVEITSSQVFTEEGKTHFLLLINDVTNQRLEVQRIQSILEALPQMAWTTDEAGKATYFTKGWYHYTGQTHAEALDTGWAEAFYPEDSPKFLEHWKTSLNTSKPFQQAARIQNNNKEYRWHLVRAAAVRDAENQVTMWVGTCTDIHDQILLTEELERKVKERTRSLEITNSELEQFAHVSSHDLQEPLRKIRTFAELLKDGAYENLDDNSKRYIDKINATAERMSNSLKALLNFTKLHREDNFEPVDLNVIVHQVLDDLELVITQKNAVIESDELPRIKASAVQMQQLFYNLLSNALKFSKKDQPPFIEIRTRELGDEDLINQPGLLRYKKYYELSFRDNGVGFDQMHATKIFTIFQRLHNRTEFEGTGIGLSLVKKVVINHNGLVSAISEIGEGSCFYIILPAG